MTKDEQSLTSLPSAEELTPLSQILVSPELASAFSITLESPKTQADVLKASEASISLARQRASVDPLDPLLACKRDPLKDSSTGSDTEKISHQKCQNDRRAAVEIEDRDGQTMEENVGAKVDAASISFPATKSRHVNRKNTIDEGWLRDCDESDSGGASEKAKRTQEDAAPADVEAFPAIKSRFVNRRNIVYDGGVAGCDRGDCGGGPAEKRKRPQSDPADSEEAADSEGNQENSGEESSARASKKPRLVWTQQLHKRFVDAVAHLGIKNAVPKTIMQLMNVEGLTRENVASHLQKYRLYLKRSQDASLEGVAPSDPLFASTPIPPSLVSAQHCLPFPAMGPMGAMTIGTPVLPPGGYGGFEHHPYGVIARAAAQGMAAAEQSQQMVENRQHASTSSQQVLKLFPANKP